MKRSELKVGDELYYAAPRNWEAGYDGKRVTVLATEPYKQPDIWSRNGKPFQVSTGAGVYVRIHSKYGDNDTVVQLGHLRGPWGTISAEVEARQDAKRLALIEAQTARRTADNIRGHAIRRAAGGGYTFTTTVGLGSHGRVETTVETLGAMLDRIDALIAEVADLEGQISNLRDDMRPTGDGS